MQKSSSLIIASDIDGMLLEFPKFILIMLTSLQSSGCKCGILTSRPESGKDKLISVFEKVGFKPDFLIGKSEDLKDMPDGVWKGKVCKDLNIDILFDDFEYSDPKMIADFFTTNEDRTIPFTGWAYKP